MTVAVELSRLGHDVHVIAGFGMPTRGPYDLGIFANAAYTAPMARFCGTSLLVCHGIVDDEAPTGDFDEVAFTSEEVRDRWEGDGPIIRQPVDLEFWSPGHSRTGRTVVRYANRGGLEWLPEVAAKLGMQFEHVRNAQPEQAREALRGAAAVLASGRCAVEAMACGAPVVVCDDRPYQGPLMGLCGQMQMWRNYSGRGGLPPNLEWVESAIREARQSTHWRTYAAGHHDVRKIVPQLLEAACCTC